MEDYILKKDLQVQGHTYRIAIFQEKDGALYYSVFAEIFENEAFELIHGGSFDSREDAEEDIKNILRYLVSVEDGY
ncbi:hypothetical protein MKX83_23660 [Cytobacillus sp. FSL M8-0252]|uniref:hypothetical protein n=1 Tax=Cytobacillus sp. FSL M8-0252 TaxID=2921621 RepID=UPI0030F896B3